MPKHTIVKRQRESGGTLAITWLDRFVEMEDEWDGLCRVKHIKTEKTLIVPKSQIWIDSDGNVCVCDCATDYYLSCEAGDIVSIVEDFEDRIFAKLKGTSGWIRK